MNPKQGLLLVNLGTPDSPSVEDVRRYLDQFLMDADVIDLPFLVRWFLVKLLILKDRPALSASQYQKIWTDRGSPLKYFSEDLLQQIRASKELNVPVELAMRYGNPSLENGIENLLSKHITELIVFPLYPQYSLAATLSVEHEVGRILGRLRKPIPCQFIPAFYNEDSYLDSIVKSTERFLASKQFDLALFSFHGLPERQVVKTASVSAHCLKDETCCLEITTANQHCYRAQCYHTAREVAHRLGWTSEQYRVGFQSRLGRTPWIKPYSDEFYRTLPKQGYKRVAVLCPSFVADCLETVEEVCIRGNEEFRRHGGEELILVPSLNAEPEWVNAVLKIANQHAATL